MMVESMVSKDGWHVLKVEAGMGSRLHDLMGDMEINFSRVCGVTGSKEESEWEDGSVNDTGERGRNTHHWVQRLRDICNFCLSCC